jgi:putative ABC transport system substrate-binding protein
MALTGDAVANGLVASNARPGGNITGTSFFFPELNAKRLELLKEALPRARRIAALANPDNPATAGALKAVEQTAASLTADFHTVEVRGPDEFPRAFSEMVRRRVEGVVVLDDGMLIGNIRKLADLTTKNHLPAIGFQEYVDAGGLMAYGANFRKLWRRAGSFVDKIFKGAKPADLPVEQASSFDLVISLRTARALGLVIPPSLVGRADQVIE